MPDQTLAPLLTMSESDNEWCHKLDRANHAAFSLVVEYLRKAVAELDAQRAARATAYAEGQEAAKLSMLLQPPLHGKDVPPNGPYVLLADLQALFPRDTPAPPREGVDHRWNCGCYMASGNLVACAAHAPKNVVPPREEPR